ncbi:MAG: WD40/YVTN/BNR-like repeat-containing protein, partial [Minisyncoccia bacterium]
NIGESLTNSISISLTGQYQTASNGVDIYISNDYGITWNQVYDSGLCKIFVVVRVMGQYQSIISSGDGIYRSNDYGQTWTKNTETNGDIYNSIITFPTAGISISHDGKYQLVVCEAIYLSTDYGVTWITTTVVNDVNREYDDHNWVACDMSSDGKYMAATEGTGEIYTSQDYGATWTKNEALIVTDKQWQDISISANGQFQTAIEKNGYVYISIDYGISWNISPEPIVTNLNWQSISVSANGQYQSAVVYGGDIYTSEIY